MSIDLSGSLYSTRTTLYRSRISTVFMDVPPSRLVQSTITNALARTFSSALAVATIS